MATVSVSPTHVAVAFTPVERVAGLVADRRIPRAAVTAAEVVPDALGAVRGWRSPGCHVPGRCKIGTWRRRGAKELVCVRRGEVALRLRLAGQRFDSVLVGTADAEGLARELAPG